MPREAEQLHIGAGFYNGNIGPWLYIERGGFMLHLYARWFREPWDHGFRWGVTLRLHDRYRMFKGVSRDTECRVIRRWVRAKHYDRINASLLAAEEDCAWLRGENEALRLALARHDLWCGHNADAPGDSIVTHPDVRSAFNA